jgi:hypothetical protein
MQAINKKRPLSADSFATIANVGKEEPYLYTTITTKQLLG